MTVSPENFWCLSTETLYRRTQGRATGLTSAEAEDRIKRFGPNHVGELPVNRLAWKVRRRFSEPLVAILLVAAAVAGFTGDLASVAIVLAVVSLSIVLDVV
jgi:Mg2+-importing ATPase